MKKYLLAVAMITVMVSGIMVLSSFTTQKQNAKAEYSQTQMNDDDWELYRSNVAYCSGDGTCEGTIDVYVNSKTLQLAVKKSSWTNMLDLTSTSAKEGYNMRFYWKNAYHYMQIDFYYYN